MKIAAVQLVSSPDLHHNLARARHWLEQAAAGGAQLALLPEYFCLMGQQDDDKLRIAETFGDTSAPIQAMLSKTARELGLWLIGGTLPLRTPNPAKVRNSCLVYGPEGQLAARYDKIHLFRFQTEREAYDEGRVLEAGNEPVAVQAGPLRVGLSICYDLRFAELYRALSFTPGQPPCELISVPAAFTYTTGEKHWELLLRARAVEMQAFVLASAQGGRHENGRRTWGHSMIVDPWGEVLDVLPEGEGLVQAELDLQRLAAVRSQLPALQHRRL
ncbi:carbon-nitrogen hydrolase family protein [Pelomonas sp. SE-A7]|uniref:carbon-nitrogen hydrolase family protein n=1 Tax=Pelomonas sp. SE-A7 TaxID=3054953 RepID=UPI00259CAC09|nr:carbon-nitrogen hydrolase family protein [Pelomonas sp. SE-A7]MDM4766940.1 carbon-nitrogen hydrolase family protein [Pelomonas sp. SE-A7]